MLHNKPKCRSKDEAYIFCFCIIPYLLEISPSTALVSLANVSSSGLVSAVPFYNKIKINTGEKMLYHVIILGDSTLSLKQRLELYRFMFPDFRLTKMKWFNKTLLHHLIFECYDGEDVACCLSDVMFDVCETLTTFSTYIGCPIENFARLLKNVDYKDIFILIKNNRNKRDIRFLTKTLYSIDHGFVVETLGESEATQVVLTSYNKHIGYKTFFWDRYPDLSIL